MMRINGWHNLVARLFITVLVCGMAIPAAACDLTDLSISPTWVPVTSEGDHSQLLHLALTRTLDSGQPPSGTITIQQQAGGGGARGGVRFWEYSAASGTWTDLGPSVTISGAAIGTEETKVFEYYVQGRAASVTERDVIIEAKWTGSPGTPRTQTKEMTVFKVEIIDPSGNLQWPILTNLHLVSVTSPDTISVAKTFQWSTDGATQLLSFSATTERTTDCTCATPSTEINAKIQLTIGAFYSTHTSPNIDFVGVANAQYLENGSYVNISARLYILKGTTVTFKALPDLSGATWPDGKPVWGGTSGASGTGETKQVTFSAKGDKTVTIECGDICTVDVTVYELTGNHVPQDIFAGRATTKYGVAEIADLSFAVDPTGITAAQIGGLQWSVAAGGGTTNNSGTSGTGSYTAGATASDVTLRLTVQAGPSRGGFVDAGLTVVAPSGSRMTRTNGNVKHSSGFASAGIQLYYWLDPKDVSFKNATFGEAAANSTNVSGFFLTCEPWNNYPDGTQITGHTENTFGAILGGNSTNGCRVNTPDEAYTGEANPYATGSFTWSITGNYIINGTRRAFGAAQDEVGAFTVSGTATMTKGGQSDSAGFNDASSGY